VRSVLANTTSWHSRFQEIAERVRMAYVINEPCIDCDACVEACPVDAITSEDMVPPEWHDYIERNAAYYRGAGS
jgi:ferredoxin